MKRVYTCIIEESGDIRVEDLVLHPDSGPAFKEAEKLIGRKVLALVPGAHAKNVLMRPKGKKKSTTYENTWAQMPDNLPPGF